MAAFLHGGPSHRAATVIYIEVKALSGFNYIKAGDVIAVQQTSPERCNIMMQGGVTIPCTEPTKDVVTRLEAFLAPAKGTADGDGSL